MKLFKPLISGFVISLLLFTIACSTNNDSNSGSSDTTEESEQVTINAAVQKHTAIDTLEKLLPEFEEKTGINVNLEVLPQEEMETKVEMALASDSDQYDVVMVDQMFVPQYARTGWIEDLSPYIEEYSNELNMDDFMQGFVDALSVEGKIYGLPVYGESTILMYNKEMFEEKGIDNPPATFEELKEVAEKLTGDGQYGIALRGQRGQGMNVYIWAGFYNAFGGQWLKDGQPDLNSEAAIEATQLYQDLITNYAPEGAATYSWDQVQLAMQQGTVGMVIDATNFATRLEDEENSNVGGKIGYALIPEGPEGSSPSSATRGFSIPTVSKHKEEAFQFIEWALSEDVQLQSALEGQRGDATRISVWESEEFKERNNYDGGKWIDVAIESMNQAKADYRPRIPEWRNMGDRLGIAISEALAGKDPKQALDEAQKEINGYFE